MKSLINSIAVLALALALAAPVVSFAQANQQSLTRAQVRADLIRAEKAGYNPLAWADFPEGEYQAAQFRARNANASGYGASTNGGSQSGDIAR